MDALTPHSVISSPPEKGNSCGRLSTFLFSGIRLLAALIVLVAVFHSAGDAHESPLDVRADVCDSIPISTLCIDIVAINRMATCPNIHRDYCTTCTPQAISRCRFEDGPIAIGYKTVPVFP